MQSSISGPWHKISPFTPGHRQEQHGRIGFRRGTNKPTMQKATAECAELVVEDVHHQEVTGIAKAEEDCWMRWEELPGKTCGGK